MNLLHLVIDDKFQDSAYEFFEAVAPGQSTYMLCEKAIPIRYLEKIAPVRVSKYAFLSKKFINSLEAYDAIIFHSLHMFALEVLARIRPEIPVLWIGMGYDYYDLLSSKPRDLLKPETRKLLATVKVKGRRHPVKIMKSLLRPILHHKAISKKKLIQRIDLFSPVLESEHSSVRAAVGEPFPSYFRWNYGKIADFVDGKLGIEKINGENILIGNSASPTNNHIEVFQNLASVGVPDQSKIIVPLSYGSFDYREIVVKEGRRLFGNRFTPITEFLPLKEYIALLSSCSSVIMNHLRQQGVGNLFIALLLGAKVYLDPENPLYKEFTSTGLRVNTLGEINSRDLNERLSPEKVNKNREILRQTRGRAAFEDYTRKLIAELERLRRVKTG